MNSGLRLGGVLLLSCFNTCMNCVLGAVADQSHCESPDSNTRVTDLVFVGDAVLLAEFLEVLVMVFELLHE